MGEKRTETTSNDLLTFEEEETSQLKGSCYKLVGVATEVVTHNIR